MHLSSDHEDLYPGQKSLVHQWEKPTQSKREEFNYKNPGVSQNPQQ